MRQSVKTILDQLERHHEGEEQHVPTAIVLYKPSTIRSEDLELRAVYTDLDRFRTDLLKLTDADIDRLEINGEIVVDSIATNQYRTERRHFNRHSLQSEFEQFKWAMFGSDSPTFSKITTISR
jgi:hypothetical protein